MANKIAYFSHVRVYDQWISPACFVVRADLLLSLLYCFYFQNTPSGAAVLNDRTNVETRKPEVHDTKNRVFNKISKSHQSPFEVHASAPAVFSARVNAFLIFLFLYGSVVLSFASSTSCEIPVRFGSALVTRQRRNRNTRTDVSRKKTPRAPSRYFPATLYCQPYRISSCDLVNDNQLPSPASKTQCA